jgi:short-subunit dehydrogenase
MPGNEITGAAALVTGASRGFGYGIATALCKAGANVVGVARDRGPLEELRAELGESFTAVPADAADPVVAGQLIDAYRPAIWCSTPAPPRCRGRSSTTRGRRSAVTNTAQIQAAADQAGSLDILINNAGVALYDDLSDRAALERSLAVNLAGTYGVTQAFLPSLSRSWGAIVNILSVYAFAPLPLIPAYSISKAAAFSQTQSLRALLAGQGVRVHAVLTGPVDTDMTRGFDTPKASPQSVARAIFDGADNGEEDIFPDPMSASMADGWRSGAAKALERQNAAFVQAQPVAS